MKITLHNAQLVDSNGIQAWMLALEVDRENGQPTEMHACIVPTDACEWRTAEYNLDDKSQEEILELLIWEFFVEQDPEAPDSLFNAEDIDIARGAYLDRIAAVSGGVGVRRRKTGQRRLQALAGQLPRAAGPSLQVLADSDIDDPIQTMCEKTPRRPEHVEARRELSREARHRYRQARMSVRRTDDVVLGQAKNIRRNRKRSSTDE